MKGAETVWKQIQVILMETQKSENDIVKQVETTMDDDKTNKWISQPVGLLPPS
jgi:hypothetical protein